VREEWEEPKVALLGEGGPLERLPLLTVYTVGGGALKVPIGVVERSKFGLTAREAGGPPTWDYHWRIFEDPMLHGNQNLAIVETFHQDTSMKDTSTGHQAMAVVLKDTSHDVLKLTVQKRVRVSDTHNLSEKKKDDQTK